MILLSGILRLSLMEKRKGYSCIKSARVTIGDTLYIVKKYNNEIDIKTRGERYKSVYCFSQYIQDLLIKAINEEQ